MQVIFMLIGVTFVFLLQAWIWFVLGFWCAAEDVKKMTHGVKEISLFWREKGVRQ